MQTAITSIMVVVLGSFALWQATDGLGALTTEGARRLEVSATKPALPKLALETMDGGEFILGETSETIAIAEFIYTNCPTICRIAGEEMARLRDRLTGLGLGAHVRLMSISFDPDHDDQEAMTDYGELHGADGAIWTIARPGEHDLAVMLDSFGVHVIPDGFGGYEHNAALHLVDKEGRLAGIFDIDDINGAALAAEAYR